MIPPEETMRPRLLCALLSALALLTRTPAAGPAPPGDAAKQAAVEKVLRKLEKDIAAVRGLAFKKPVVAKVIARPKGAPGGIQGYYSTREKALYLYDDIRGSYERGVLIHEMVHALQDQHFGLGKLHATSFGSDAELARAALVEGDATFTMIELLKKDQPRVAHMLATPLEKARNLQNAFLYAQGARYVRALHQQGGWPLVNMRYSFPPSSTAAVLHPEGVPTINLGPGATRGEYGLIRLLAGNPATAPEAVSSSAGWRGDRVIEDGPSRAWVVAFASPAQALRFRDALARLRAAEGPARGRVRRVLLHGNRVLELDAPDEKAYRALADRVEGPPALVIWSLKDERELTFGELIDRLARADVVCVGESHDSDLHHRVQLQIIKALFARDERLGVGMEMFQRPYQKALDRYLAGATNEQTFLEDSEYRTRWGYEWSLYRPIVEFCRRNGVPVAALNAPRELTQRVSKVGYAGLSPAERKELGAVDFHVGPHRAHWYDLLARMHGKAKVPPEQKERSYQVMAVWDEYMAESAARFQRARGVRRMVVLAGSGHVDSWFGIPLRAARRTGGRVLTVKVEVGGDLARVAAQRVADFVVVVR
jgi:uncharacterized iron-regulated protein